jgi:bla regulator protein BlaR1
VEPLLIESAIRSTLIAAVIWLVLFAMRIKTASVLHAVWASVFVLMVLLPVWVAWGPKASLPVLPAQANVAIAPPPLPARLVERTSISSASPVRQDGGYALRENAITGVYLLGVFVLLLRLAIGTIRANRLTSASCVAPVTVGLLRPRVILPESSREWPQAQLDAVLTHENEHARRRDPLFQWIALLNRAIFWFHPLAWWLEQRLSGLAEEACDAVVLSRGYDPHAYSEYLLALARSVLQTGTRVNAIGMAMPGVGLKHRIRQMLSDVPIPKISVLRMAFTVAVCAGVAAILAAGTLIHAQSAQPGPKFEVASIRSCGAGGGNSKEGPPGGSPIVSPGRLNTGCAALAGSYPLAGLIQRAYGRLGLGHPVPLGSALPISGGPSWIYSARYVINAKAPDNASEGTMVGPMLQALLEDRFRLKVHRETREVPVYALTVAKGGSKLQQVAEGSCVHPDYSIRPIPPLPPGKTYCNDAVGGRKGPNTTLNEDEATLLEFSKLLGLVLDRPIVDKTGLLGKYNFHLEFLVDQTTPGALSGFGPPSDGPPAASIFTVVQEQLGLKLEPAKGAREFLLIDHVERPSEN